MGPPVFPRFSIVIAKASAFWAYMSISKRKINILSRKAFLVITLLVILYGITMEFVQKNWVPFRSFDNGDIIADAIGALIGFFIAAKLFIKNKTRSTGL